MPKHENAGEKKEKERIEKLEKDIKKSEDILTKAKKFERKSFDKCLLILKNYVNNKEFLNPLYLKNRLYKICTYLKNTKVKFDDVIEKTSILTKGITAKNKNDLLKNSDQNECITESIEEINSCMGEYDQDLIVSESIIRLKRALSNYIIELNHKLKDKDYEQSILNHFVGIKTGVGMTSELMKRTLGKSGKEKKEIEEKYLNEKKEEYKKIKEIVEKNAEKLIGNLNKIDETVGDEVTCSRNNAVSKRCEFKKTSIFKLISYFSKKSELKKANYDLSTAESFQETMKKLISKFKDQLEKTKKILERKLIIYNQNQGDLDTASYYEHCFYKLLDLSDNIKAKMR